MARHKTLTLIMKVRFLPALFSHCGGNGRRVAFKPQFGKLSESSNLYGGTIRYPAPERSEERKVHNMNKVLLIGRLARDPEDFGDVSKYTLAVDRKGKDAGADFVPIVCFGKTAEFAKKFLHKGMKIAVEGRVLTGSYQTGKGKNAETVYTFDVVADNHEFCEPKKE